MFERIYESLELANLNTPARLTSKYNKESHETHCSRSSEVPDREPQCSGGNVVYTKQVPSLNSGLSGREAFGVSNYLNRGWRGMGGTVTSHRKDTWVSCHPLQSFLLKGAPRQTMKPLNVTSPILPYCGA